MTLKFKEHRIGDELWSSLLQVLHVGNSVSRRIAASRKFAVGSLRTWLPEGMSDKQIMSIEHGRGTPSRYADTWAAHLIHTFLSSGSGRAAYFENLIAKRGDAWLARCNSDLRFYGTEVYHLIHNDASLHVIHQTMKEAHELPHHVGVLYEGPVPSGVDFGDAEIEAIAAGARKLLFGVYDGEGYIGCELVPSSST